MKDTMNLRPEITVALMKHNIEIYHVQSDDVDQIYVFYTSPMATKELQDEIIELIRPPWGVQFESLPENWLNKIPNEYPAPQDIMDRAKYKNETVVYSTKDGPMGREEVAQALGEEYQKQIDELQAQADQKEKNFQELLVRLNEQRKHGEKLLLAHSKLIGHCLDSHAKNIRVADHIIEDAMAAKSEFESRKL